MCGTNIVPLRVETQFSFLFEICRDPNITLREVINTQWGIRFKRQLVGVLLAEWNSILYKISKMSFTHAQDKISWKCDSSENILVKILYKFF